MSDLNKRLQLGPQAPKKDEPAPEEQEEVKEKAPLADARKGRARGPARRAPAKSPAPASVAPAEQASTLVFSTPSTLWSIDPEEDTLQVASYQDKETAPPVETKATESETPTLATNIAGQALHEPSEIALGAEKASALPSSLEDTHAEQAEETNKETVLAEASKSNEEIEPVKTSDSPPVVSSNEPAAAPAKEEDLSESTATLKPAEGNVE